MSHSRAKHITVVVPGLFGPASRPASLFESGDIADLEKLLGKATVKSIDLVGLEQTLFALFSYSGSNTDANLPVAAVSALADLERRTDDWWVRTDPVYLHADQDKLILSGSEVLDIRQQEADMLVRELNDHFAADGCEFFAAKPGRWYLRMDKNTNVQFSLLGDVIGRDIEPWLPRGEDKAFWHRFLNEVQMILHSSPVNQQRNQEQKLPINSIWCWGGGKLPEIVNAQWELVFSDDPLSKGLSKLCGVPHAQLPDQWFNVQMDYSEQGSAEQRYLIILKDLQMSALNADVLSWKDELLRLQKEWFAPLFTELKKHEVQSIEIIPCNGRVYRVEKRHLWKFWKKRKSIFKEYLGSE